MEHVGIDLASVHSHVVVLNESGKPERSVRKPTVDLPSWLRSRPPSRVVMEACTQSPAVARMAMEAGHTTVVVPGNVVRALGVGARGIKTDERDALVLAQASLRNEQLPSVHLRSEQSQDLRESLAARQTLLSARRNMLLYVKSWLRGRLITLRGRASPSTFTKHVRALVSELPDGFPLAIDTLLNSYDELSEQLKTLDAELERRAEAHPVCQRLMQVPGVGVVSSLAFVAQVDDPHRFRSADELGSYLALTPGEHSTGGKRVRTGTIKAGPTALKATLVQCAWVLWRSCPNEPMVLWARAIAERRGKRIAIVALARKLATILWSMWRHGTAYDPSRTATARRACNDEGQEVVPNV